MSIPEWWVRADGWDFWVDYRAGIWESDTHDAIIACVRPGSTYVDIGAWIGPTVLWAAPIASRVLAVEPDPVALEHLRLNVAEYPNVETVHGAIADHTGTAGLAAHNEGFGSSMSRLADHGVPVGGTWDVANPIEVPSWTLPDLFDAFDLTDVSLVKMDIEGGEGEVLEVAAPFLAKNHVALLVSFHQTWWTREVERSWFDGFTELRGDWTGTSPILAIP